MKNLPRYLRIAGLASAVIAAIMALVSVETSTAAIQRRNPESAIAMAIVAFVLIRASEQSPT
jgi:hypothetical protein